MKKLFSKYILVDNTGRNVLPFHSFYFKDKLMSKYFDIFLYTKTVYAKKFTETPEKEKLFYKLVDKGKNIFEINKIFFMEDYKKNREKYLNKYNLKIVKKWQ